MTELILTDAGRRITLQFNDTGEEAPAPISEAAPHVRFFEWWKGQCVERHIPAPAYGGAGYKILKRLLKQHSYGDLQTYAVRCFLDHREKLMEVSDHIIMFAHLLPSIIEEKNL